MNLGKKTLDRLDDLFRKKVGLNDPYKQPPRSKYTLRDELIERGNEFIFLKEYEKAFDCYGSLISINDDYMGWHGIADVLIEKSRDWKKDREEKTILKKRAVHCLLNSIERKANNYDSWLFLGNIMEDQGFIGYAKMCFDKCDELTGKAGKKR